MLLKGESGVDVFDQFPKSSATTSIDSQNPSIGYTQRQNFTHASLHLTSSSSLSQALNSITLSPKRIRPSFTPLHPSIGVSKYSWSLPQNVLQTPSGALPRLRAL